jgi:hypothetical protein
MKCRLLILISIIIQISCNSEKKSDPSYDAEEVIKINKAIDLSIYELVEDITFIKLENSPNNEISVISNIYITEDLIFVGDRNYQGIFVFSFPEGKFIRKIDAFGRGPQEYSRMNDFNINKSKMFVEVLDSNLKKIFRYNFEGKFISSSTVPFLGSVEFCYLNNNIIISKNIGKGSSELPYQLVTLNNSQIKNKYLKIEKPIGVTFGVSNTLKSYENNVYFSPIYSPYLFEINEKGIKAKYLFDFEENWIDDKIIYGNYKDGMSFLKEINDNNYVSFVNATVGSNFISINYYKNDKNYSCLFDVNTKLTYNINDFENSICLKNRFEYYSNGYFISVLDPVILSESFKKGNLKNNLISEEFLSNVSDFDNPILMLTKFKIN